MRFEEVWRPSVFVERGGRWRASLDTASVGASSRVQVDAGARAYSSLLAEHATGDLLDLGCGKVPCYGMYRPYVRTITCTDWPTTLNVSRHVDFYCDLTRRLPLPDSSFDTVVLTDVLEHLPTPDDAIAEVRRVLRPGGVVIIGVPFMYRIHEAPHDYHRYTEFRLRRFCLDHDLEVLRLVPNGGPLAVWLDVTAKLLTRRRLGRPLGAVLTRGALRCPPPAPASTDMPTAYTLVAQRPKHS